jgi:hypothetical protein
VVAGSIDRQALAPAELVESEAAREVLAGSRVALGVLREALGMGRARGDGR